MSDALGVHLFVESNSSIRKLTKGYLSLKIVPRDLPYFTPIFESSTLNSFIEGLHEVNRRENPIMIKIKPLMKLSVFDEDS